MTIAEQIEHTAPVPADEIETGGVEGGTAEEQDNTLCGVMPEIVLRRAR